MITAIITAIMLTIAGHTIPYSCQPGLANNGAYGHYSPGNGQMVAVDAPNGVQNIIAQYPNATIQFDAGICKSLATLILDPTGTKLHYTHPSISNWYEAIAVLTVLHESEHEWQFSNGYPYSDSQAQCVAMKDFGYWLNYMGVSGSKMIKLEKDATLFSEGLPPDYHGGNC